MFVNNYTTTTKLQNGSTMEGQMERQKFHQINLFLEPWILQAEYQEITVKCQVKVEHSKAHDWSFFLLKAKARSPGNIEKSYNLSGILWRN